jgi:hypothetical protein
METINLFGVNFCVSKKVMEKNALAAEKRRLAKSGTTNEIMRSLFPYNPEYWHSKCKPGHELHYKIQGFCGETYKFCDCSYYENIDKMANS